MVYYRLHGILIVISAWEENFFCKIGSLHSHHLLIFYESVIASYFGNGAVANGVFHDMVHNMVMLHCKQLLQYTQSMLLLLCRVAK